MRSAFVTGAGAVDRAVAAHAARFGGLTGQSIVVDGGMWFS